MSTRPFRIWSSLALLIYGAAGCGSSDTPGGGPTAGSGGAGVSTGGGGGSASPGSGGFMMGSELGGGSGTSGTGGGSAGSGSAGSGSAGSGGGAPSQPGSGKLAPGSIFYQDIRSSQVDGESATVMAALQKSGWGDTGKRTTLGIDFSFEITQAADTVPRRSFTQPADALPDCDTGPVPLPPGGKVEGSASGDYACDGGDCHLLVYQGMRLYELYQANVTGGMATGGTFTGTCLSIWDLGKDYWAPTPPPNYSRGDDCNGADAGDMPMAPLLLTAEEIKAGKITHALRFTISNNRIRKGVYVHPATHIGGPSGGADTLPYGARLRLRADYPMAGLPSDAARAIATALQTYGMFLADGGNIYVSATTEASSATNASALTAMQPSDFQMVDGGARIPWKGNCKRTPISN